MQKTHYSEFHTSTENGKQMVRIKYPCCQKWHLITCSAVLSRLVTRIYKMVSSICNQEVTDCFTLAAVSNRLSSRSSGWKSLGFILPTEIVTSYGATAKHIIRLRFS